MVNILSIKKIATKLHGPYSLDVSGQTCAVITGESGAGKSLLLRMIADLIPNEGQVFLNQFERNQFKPSQWRQKVTYVSAETGWWAKRVEDHIDHLSIVKPLLSLLNLKESLLTSEVSQLSTGEKQRFALLRALSPGLEFLLLDEMTSALDPQSVLLVEQLIMKLQDQGIGILLVSHNMEQVERLATHRYRLTATGLNQG